FVHYVDLTNEQVFLRCIGRVSDETWENWCDGIRDMLARPAFGVAWSEIKRRAPHSFEELRHLEDSGFTADPKQWYRDRKSRRPSDSIRKTGLADQAKVS